MYTPYNGTDFLKAYFKDRKSKIKLDKKKSIESIFSDIFLFLKKDINRI